MNLFKKMLNIALEIDGIRLQSGVRDREDERDIKELERTTQALVVQNGGRFWDADCGKTREIVRRQLRKSEKLPGELERQAGKARGDNAQTRQMRQQAYQLRQASRSLLNLLSDLEKKSSATFNGIALRPEVMTNPIVLKHPGGPAGDSKPPSATLTVTGTEGAHVTLDIEHVYMIPYGGHNHNVGRAPEFVGSFSTKHTRAQARPGGSPALEFDLARSGEPVQVTYQATDFCSRFRVTLTMQGFGSCTFPLEVKFDKEMVNLTEKNHPYIETYTNDGTHPDSHWGRPELVEAIINLADAFGQELEAGRFGEVTEVQRKLWVNDLSLPWGGLFKSYAKMEEKAHTTHRWGQNADISYNKMNNAQRGWFGDTGQKYLDIVERHNKNLDTEHWHCSVWN